MQRRPPGVMRLKYMGLQVSWVISHLIEVKVIADTHQRSAAAQSQMYTGLLAEYLVDPD